MMNISRRRLVQAGTALAATRAVGVSAQTPIATPNGNMAPQTGIERDKLTIGTYGLPASLDPAAENSNVAWALMPTPYETLIRRDVRNGDVYVPMLATSWTQTSDTELDFVLREGVTFQSGGTMTAEDVVFTFDRVLKAPEDSPLLAYSSWMSTLEKVEALDDMTVRFTTKQPDPTLLKRLAFFPGFIVSKARVEELGDEEFAKVSDAGTGPYKITSFVPSNSLTLERFEGYWGDPSPAKTVELTVIPELAARMTALLNGEVDMINNVSPDQVETLTSQDSVEIRQIIINNAHVLSLNTHQPGLEDKRLRQALSLAIDRPSLIEALWGGQARHKRSLQWEDYGPVYVGDYRLSPYDIEKARQLVEESDYNGEPISYQLVPGYYVMADQAAQVIVASWQSIGINAVVEQNDSFKNGEERFVHTWSCTDIWADPAGTISRAWGANSFHQDLYWDAPAEFNDLETALLTTMDPAERQDIHRQMLEIWDDEVPGIDLWDPIDVYAVAKGINWEPHPLQAVDLHAYNFSFND